MPEPLVPSMVEAYVAASSTPDPQLLQLVERETRERFPDRVSMLTGHPIGRLLAMISRMVRPRLIVEVGTFTGYSGLSLAEGLAAEGQLITLDVSEEHAAVARRHFDASPQASRMEIRLGPALESLARIDGPIDLAFIDADKENYHAYYEAILPRLSDRGVILVDNVLWYGRIFDDSDQTADTRAIREFNRRLAADERVECVMLTERDGLTLIRRR